MKFISKLALGAALLIASASPAAAQVWLDSLLAQQDTAKAFPVRLSEAVRSSQDVAIGEEAPPLSFTNLATGEAQSLADFAGQPVLVHFMRTTCRGSQQQMPTLSEIQSDYEDVAVLYLSPQPSEVMEEFAQEHGYAGTYGTVGDYSALEPPYQFGATPTMMLADGEGVIRAMWLGPRGYDSVEEQVLLCRQE